MQYAVCGIGSSEYAVCQSMGATENAHMHRVKSNSYSEQSERALPAEQVQCKTENNLPVGRAIHVTTYFPLLCSPLFQWFVHPRSQVPGH